MAFDIMALQRGRGPVQARSKADEGRAVLKYIDVDDLVPSEENFYSMSAIEELAGLIELSGGVKQPALVVPLGGGKYKVIAGHRRRLASIQLVQQGKDAYRKMPCMVDATGRETGADADELRAIDEAILLIATNSQREKTDWDKVQEVTRLRELLERKRQFEKLPGQMRKIIAEQLGTTPAQVGRYDSIQKHLLHPFIDWLEQGEIGISVAYELSTLPPDDQVRAAEECKERREPITLEDVRRWRTPIRPAPDPLPPGKITTIMADETGPAPTPEQMEKILEQAKDRPASGAVVLPEMPEKDMPAVEQTETPGVESRGENVNLPAPSSPAPVETAPEPEKEKLSGKRAAMILEDLREYCETMMGMEDERAETWIEYADALAVAIAALRK